MKYKYRYIKRKGYYIPEYSVDGIKWLPFKEDHLSNFLKELLGFISKYERIVKLVTVDDKIIYFITEVEVNCFLGAAKSTFDKEIKEFEHLN